MPVRKCVGTAVLLVVLRLTRLPLADGRLHRLLQRVHKHQLFKLLNTDVGDAVPVASLGVPVANTPLTRAPVKPPPAVRATDVLIQRLGVLLHTLLLGGVALIHRHQPISRPVALLPLALARVLVRLRVEAPLPADYERVKLGVAALVAWAPLEVVALVPLHGSRPLELRVLQQQAHDQPLLQVAQRPDLHPLRHPVVALVFVPHPRVQPEEPEAVKPAFLVGAVYALTTLLALAPVVQLLIRLAQRSVTSLRLPLTIVVTLVRLPVGLHKQPELVVRLELADERRTVQKERLLHDLMRVVVRLPSSALRPHGQLKPRLHRLLVARILPRLQLRPHHIPLRSQRGP